MRARQVRRLASYTDPKKSTALIWLVKSRQGVPFEAIARRSRSGRRGHRRLEANDVRHTVEELTKLLLAADSSGKLLEIACWRPPVFRSVVGLLGRNRGLTPQRIFTATSAELAEQYGARKEVISRIVCAVAETAQGDEYET